MSNKEPSAAQKAIGDISPKLAQLTDDVLFGDVWERPELSKRDRSLVTVTALIVGSNTEQLPFHLKRAKENGVTEAELIETITHLGLLQRLAQGHECPHGRQRRVHTLSRNNPETSHLKSHG